MNEFIEKTNYREKKVTSAEIIVTGTKDKPYFEIRYKEVGKEDYSIGYSSYDLNNVFDWKEDCFEIVNQLAEEHNGGWIPCDENLPNHNQTVIFQTEDGMVETGHYDVNEDWCVNDSYFPNAFRFVAWQPLPEPYKKVEKFSKS